MNKSYTLDFDGLDGLYELSPSISIQKTNDPISLSRDRNSDDQIAPTKRPSSSFLLGFSLLALSSLIIYVGGGFLHKDAPIIEPLVQLKDKDIKEVELLTAKQEKQQILDKIDEIQEQLVEGEKTDFSKLPITAFSNNEINRTIPEESYNETHIVKAYSLTPDAFNKHSETVKHKKESKTKNAPVSLTKDKERTFDSLVLNEAYLDETELEPKPIELIKKGVEIKNVDSAVATTRAKNEERKNSKPNLKPSDLATVSMSNISTKHDTFNNNTINNAEISNYILRFDFNKTAILSLSTPKEATLKSFLHRCPDDIQVVGHTCNLGSVSDNQAIGRIRAEEVKDLLVSIGFSAERIQVLSGGQNEPVASNSTLAGRALNRRVVVDCFSQSENNKKRK